MDKTVIAYMDILGYKDLVDLCEKNVQKIKDIEKCLKEGLSWADDFQQLPANDSIRKANQVRLAKQSYRMISDAILVSMPLSNLPLLRANLSEEENIKTHLKLFLRDISYLYSHFMCNLGVVFRGGVAIGGHYESTLNKPESLFIFSKALSRAYEAEQDARRLNYPAILFNDSFKREVSALYGNNDDYQEEFLKDVTNQDNSGNTFLNVYYFIDKDAQKAKEDCRRMRDVIKFHLERLGEGRTLDKYLWLKTQHNDQMKNRFVFTDLML